MDDLNEDDDLIPPDERRHTRLLDPRRQADGELSDSDDEGEDDRRNVQSHRDPDSVGITTAKRLPVGIMSTGTTHGIGPTVSQSVVAAHVTSSSTAQSDMDVDDDEPPLAETVRARAKARPSEADAMAVDQPAEEVSSTSQAGDAPAAAPASTPAPPAVPPAAASTSPIVTPAAAPAASTTAPASGSAPSS